MLLFSAQNLTQAKGNQDIFKNINLEVQAGEKVALVGPNGIGKTTLLRILARIDQPAGGCLHFYRPVRTGYLAQNDAFPPEATVQTVLETTSLDKPNINWQEALSRFNFTGLESQKSLSSAAVKKPGSNWPAYGCKDVIYCSLMNPPTT